MFGAEDFETDGKNPNWQNKTLFCRLEIYACFAKKHMM